MNMKDQEIKLPVLLTREEAAKYLGVSKNTLRVWASKKIYRLPYRKIGKFVHYLVEDLDRFIAERIKGK